MASVAHFLYDAENIIDEIESRLVTTEENATKNYVCARTIQRIFRGHVTRLHIKLLHQSATCIQKNWRAFLARIIYRIRLKEKFDEMCWYHYNSKARTIQKWWRGFRVRLNVFNFYGLKDWLAFVSQQNQLLKSLVEACQSKANAAEMKQREEEAKEWIVYILFKLHHLLRTHQLSGIYSLPNTTDLSEIEKLLKCLKYKDFMIFYNAYMEDLRQERAKELPPYILQQCKYPGHFEREYYDHKKPHKDFLFSHSSYHNPPQLPPSIETREKMRTRTYREASEEGVKLRTTVCNCQPETTMPLPSDKNFPAIGSESLRNHCARHHTDKPTETEGSSTIPNFRLNSSYIVNK